MEDLLIRKKTARPEMIFKLGRMMGMRYIDRFAMNQSPVNTYPRCEV